MTFRSGEEHRKVINKKTLTGPVSEMKIRISTRFVEMCTGVCCCCDAGKVINLTAHVHLLHS